MAIEESCLFSNFYWSILHNVYALEKMWSQYEQCSTLYCMAVCTLKIFTLQMKQIENILMSLLSKCLIFDTWLHMSKLEVNFLRLPMWSLESNWVSRSDWSRKHNSHPSGRPSFFPVSTSGRASFLAVWVLPDKLDSGCIHLFEIRNGATVKKTDWKKRQRGW